MQRWVTVNKCLITSGWRDVVLTNHQHYAPDRTAPELLLKHLISDGENLWPRLHQQIKTNTLILGSKSAFIEKHCQKQRSCFFGCRLFLWTCRTFRSEMKERVLLIFTRVTLTSHDQNPSKSSPSHSSFILHKLSKSLNDRRVHSLGSAHRSPRTLQYHIW